MSKLSKIKENTLRDILNKFPTYSDVIIAQQLNINRKTVQTYRQKILVRYDSEFISIVAGKFIAAYGKASDYWIQQITELEELKNSTHTIYIQNKETGGSFEKEVPLSPMEKLAIAKQQSDLQKNILFLAGQGEVREVLRIMRSGKIPMLEAEPPTV